jgi:hypothetical protein
MYRLVQVRKGRTIAQAVSSRLPTAEARVRSLVEEVALWQFFSN